jgi:anti-sigma regulatory factor (Ser/Thr protein kinase)
VHASDADVCITVTDLGGPRPIRPPETPDLDAKLIGRQSPRGWGLFLIEHMVDQVSDECQGCEHSVHLRMRLADGDAGPADA